ncbi:Tripartite motif-containing protein 16 [Liparis tanakae]|uniref:Tripartite motif-containing protein 16 n=1 Tax=Liparis tanakae TaxID=230148 RepID=A0A4Z2FNX8_9TELE|nr:Tripartite motif-containing protein 16 [Liparis tanakae]
MDYQNGCNTVSAAAEKTGRQIELEGIRHNIHQRIQDREKDLKLLYQEVEALYLSSDKTVEDIEKIFTELIRLMENKCSDVKQQVKSQQRTEVSRVKELQEKLEQEITELKRNDAELKLLPHTQDLKPFLLNHPSLSPLADSTHSSSFIIRPLKYFEDVTAAVSEVRDNLQDVLRKKWTDILLTVTDVDVLLYEAEPKTRAGFLRYSREITLDPNTVHAWLALSNEDRKASFMSKEQSYSSHPDRFTRCWQVLGKEALTGRGYWELEWSGGEGRGGGVHVALSYNNIIRTDVGDESLFGWNNKSWVLDCYNNGYNFRHNRIYSSVSGPQSSRLGVYLNHRAGILSFYSISETMTLLHRVQTTFTQPLYAGLRMSHFGASAEFFKPN